MLVGKISNKLINIQMAGNGYGLNTDRKNSSAKSEIRQSQYLDRVCFGNRINSKHYNEFMLNNLVSFKGLKHTTEERKRLYTKDQEYRKILAESSHCDPDSLISIVGVQEFNDLLSKDLRPVNFIPTINNHENPEFIANLHIHTEHSDGAFNVEGLLEDATNYAAELNKDAKSKKRVIIAIQDHDSVKGLKEAIKLISENPKKYEDVRVVLGGEFGVKFKDPKFLTKPIEMELHGYCLNPFNEKLNEHLDALQASYQKLADGLMAMVKEKYGFTVDLNEFKFKSPYRNLNTMTVAGTIPTLETLLVKKYEEENGKSLEFRETIRSWIKQNVRRYCMVGNDKTRKPNTIIIDKLPGLKDLTRIIRETGGEVGISHPLRIRLDNCIRKGKTLKKAVRSLVKSFKKAGGNAIEFEYQYAPAFPKNHALLSYYKRYCHALRTGGLDTHGLSIRLK